MPVAFAALAGQFTHHLPRRALTTAQPTAATFVTVPSSGATASALSTDARAVVASAKEPPVTPTTAAPSPAWVDPVTPSERAAWYRVNQCEEHGYWHVRGGAYQGGLGISVSNWITYGGLRDFGPEWAASPDQQIVVAMRIDRYPPDQYGCGSGW